MSCESQHTECVYCSHISEHLQELKEAVNVSAMSPEELEFHYFKWVCITRHVAVLMLFTYIIILYYNIIILYYNIIILYYNIIILYYNILILYYNIIILCQDRRHCWEYIQHLTRNSLQVHDCTRHSSHDSSIMNDCCCGWWWWEYDTRKYTNLCITNDQNCKVYFRVHRSARN